MKIRAVFSLFFLVALVSQRLFAQLQDKYQSYYYDFIHYGKNEVYLPQTNTFDHFFAQLDSLALYQDRKVNIVHIGDSHLQADVFSHTMRTKIQSIEHFGNGGRGFLFPYNLAKTNNPWNYKVSYAGPWVGCRSSLNNQKCEWGASGVTGTTYSQSAKFGVELNPQSDTITPKYKTNRVRVFYPTEDETMYSVKLVYKDSLVLGIKNPSGYEEFLLDTLLTEVKFILEKDSSYQTHFVIQGLQFFNDDPGVVYHTIGVNGAKVTSYLKCTKFVDHFRSLDADLVIISLGTNDAYPVQFDQVAFRSELNELLDSIQKAAPKASILLTAPGDGLRNKWSTNYNNARLKNMQLEVARQRNCGLWDFYSVMGGLKSIQEWKSFGLGQSDYLHLTSDGYKLQGGLLFDTLILDLYFGNLQRITID